MIAQHIKSENQECQKNEIAEDPEQEAKRMIGEVIRDAEPPSHFARHECEGRNAQDISKKRKKNDISDDLFASRHTNLASTVLVNGKLR